MAANQDSGSTTDFIVLPNIGPIPKADFAMAIEQMLGECLQGRASPNISVKTKSKYNVVLDVNGPTVDQQVVNTAKSDRKVKVEPNEEAQSHLRPLAQKPATTQEVLVSTRMPSPPHRDATPMGTPEPRKSARSKTKPNLDDLVLPAATLPENTTMALIHQTHDAAIRAVKETSLKWSPPTPDPSIPTSNAERRAYVVRLVLAFFNREDLQNMGHGRGKRWDDVKSHYPQAAVEKVCWDIVHIAERLHNEGPSFLSIHDLHMQKEIQQDCKLTFEERIQYLVKLLCFYKSKCEDFMKGAQSEEIVACPKQKLSACKINLKQNKGRAIVLKKGREANAAETAQDGQEEDFAQADSVAGDGEDLHSSGEETATAKAVSHLAEGGVTMHDADDSIIQTNEINPAATAPSSNSSELPRRTLKRGSTDTTDDECVTDTAESETKRVRVK
ncbi:hypothetical protein FB567DRAFT_588699 [Paraphoma chrysanthemicola]|uniref:Uncharacterized protein n=1 Tax=Paraphoma chrysanthemicola TaxID=798071 RepID=A0A8K0W3F3_9PLEO|nr:hypothetical protein FB567DRAFT_588699 [Paraphoma chrysanthemicola]